MTGARGAWLRGFVRWQVLFPLALAVSVLAVSALVRSIEMRAEAQQRIEQAGNVSAVLSARLSEHAASRLNAAMLFAPRRNENGILDSEAFRETAQRMHELFTDIQAISYADPAGILRIVTPVSGNEAAIGLNLRSLDLPASALALADETGTLQVTPPIILAQGGRGFSGYLPLRDDDGFLGYLNIVFRNDALIGPLLTDHIRENFDIRVLDGDALVFASSDAGPRAEAATLTMIDVANRTWRVEIAPVKGAGSGTFFDGLIMPFGLAAALIVAFLGHLAVTRQASLAQSRAQLLDFAQVSSDWFWETDSNHALTWISDGFERALGARKEDFLGRTRVSMIATVDSASTPAGQVLDLTSRQPFRDFTYPIRVGDQKKWVRTSGMPIFDPDGQFLGYRGTASNVTAEVSARAEVERAQWLLQSAVENLHEHFSVWDAEDRLVIANTRFRTFFADVLAELAPDPTYETFLRKMIEKGRLPAAQGRAEEYVGAAMARRRDLRGEAEHRFSDGRIFRVREARMENGSTVVTATEVTAERRSEAALRASEERYELASRQVSIWDWDILGQRLYISPQFATRLGYTAGEFAEITDRSLADLLHPDDSASYRAALAHHLAVPGSVFSHEHRFRTKSGEYRWFLARGQAVTDADGRAVRSTGILTDITERVALEDRLQQAQKMESIGQLTGGLAHDFNNLLAVVQGHAEALAEQEGPGQKRAAAILRAARRGSDLTQRLLAFARRQPLSPSPIDCVELSAGLLDLLRRTLGDGVQITLDMPPGLWPALADPGQVENALLNLIINARDAMPGGGEVRITAQNRTVTEAEAATGGAPRPGHYVMLSVADQGHGMTEEVRRQAFEPFFTTKGVGKGSGLGLSMVYGFALQSGGTAVIDSAPGAGTTVSLFLPRAPVHPVAPPRPGNEADLPRGRGQTVLVVEDDPEISALMAEMLTDLGYGVRSADGLAAARDLLAAEAGIDLVLSDVVMPGAGGRVDYATALAAENPGLKMIFMSGYPAEASPGGSIWDLGHPLLVKPFGKAKLAAALADILAD